MVAMKNRGALANISELRNEPDEVLSRLKESPVILKRRGKPVAVFIDYAQYEKFEELLDLAEGLVLGSLAAARDRSAKNGDFVDLNKW